MVLEDHDLEVDHGYEGKRASSVHFRSEEIVHASSASLDGIAICPAERDIFASLNVR